MYTIHVDGKLLYKTGAEDEAQIALNVKPSLDIESSGSLSFVLPPGNGQYNNIRKMKSIITMHQDGRMIFRGRVTETERDIFGQKDVYCEGDLSFLLDSLWEEQVWTGKVQAFFRHLIANHNDQVENEKRFTVGIITAVDAETPYEAEFRVETRRFWDTSTVIEDRLLGVYGGYIRTRTEGDVTYIDWLSEYGEESDQEIRFGVNMLDLKDKLDAGDVFTCLIPLGYSEMGDDGTYKDPVNITSVNGGLEYIQDDAGVAKYGKIWRSKTWGNTKDPAKLKKKAEEYLKTGAELRTLTLKAVDMHFINGDISMLAIGKKVLIESDPHGIELKMVLSKMEPDPENPENSTYTFGVKPRTLSEAVIRNERETSSLTGGKSGSRGGGGGSGKSIQEEAQDIIRWARIIVDEANANINLNAGEINQLNGKMTQAGIEIDGLNSEITLKANKVYVDAQITTVKTLIADEIEAVYSDVNYSIAESVSTGALTVSGNGWVSGTMTASSTSTGSLRLNGNSIGMSSKTVLTGASLEVSSSGGTVTGVKLNRSTSTIYYLDWD